MCETGNEWDTVEPVGRGALDSPFQILICTEGLKGALDAPFLITFILRFFWPKHSNLSFFTFATF